MPRRNLTRDRVPYGSFQIRLTRTRYFAIHNAKDIHRYPAPRRCRQSRCLLYGGCLGPCPEIVMVRMIRTAWHVAGMFGPDLGMGVCCQVSSLFGRFCEEDPGIWRQSIIVLRRRSPYSTNVCRRVR